MGRLLFGLARSSLGRWLAGWAFTYMSFVIPVKRLRETDTLMAFHHPQPSYPLHILLVPKRPFSSLRDVPPNEVDFFSDFLKMVGSLIDEFGLEQSGYRLITNGGAYQDVPHLHVHLVSYQVNSTE